MSPGEHIEWIINHLRYKAPEQRDAVLRAQLWKLINATAWNERERCARYLDEYGPPGALGARGIRALRNEYADPEEPR